MSSEKKGSDQNQRRQNLTAVQIQQEYFEAVGDADWNLFEKKDRKCLLQKVAIALCGAPTEGGNLQNCVKQVDDNYELQGYELRDKESCMHVFNKILEQAQYSHNNKNILISVLRVVCVIPTRELSFYELTPSDYWMDLHRKTGDKVHIYVFHVFSIRKCVPKSGKKPCRIFIDHVGRVYQNWNNYLSDNVLPQCVMVVPRNGEYKGTTSNGTDKTPVVLLSVLPSPALGTGAKVVSAVDTVSSVANIGALASAVGAVFAAPAVAPVLLGTAVGVGVVTGVYAIGRSTAQLIDRSQHDQSIGLGDSEARAAWLNIIISTVGLSCSAATKLLSWAARSGTNIKILMTAVEYLKYSNIATGFVGVGNGLWEMTDKYARYGDLPTGTELFQFTTSALFLGIGVMTNQTAQEIVQDAQAKHLNDYRESLASNTKRRIFDKVAAETRRTNGMINGNAEVIKALKSIENKDDFFAKLNRINKQVNKNKVRISLSGDGKVLINNNYKHSVSNMYQLGKEGREQLFARYGPATVTTKNAPTRIYPSCTTNSSFVRACREASIYVCPEDVTRVVTFLSQLNPRDQEYLLQVLSELSGRLHDALLLLTAKLISSLTPAQIDQMIGILGGYKIPIVLFVLYFLKDQIKKIIGERDYENDNAMVLVLKSFIHDGKIDEKTILVLKEKLIKIMCEHKNIKDFRDDGARYNFIVQYRTTYCRELITIRAGEEIEAGPHKILIMPTTIDKLLELFEKHSQNVCDQIIHITLRIISLLNESEIEHINAVNPDEDIIIVVARYVLNETNLHERNIHTEKDIETTKSELIKWRKRQYIRRRYRCSQCTGYKYE